MVTRSKVNIHCPLTRTDGTIPWPSSKPSLALITSIISGEPQSYTEASKFHEWCEAMKIEFEALLENHT